MFKKRKRGAERFIIFVLASCAAITLIATAGIILALSKDSFDFFSVVPLSEFLFGTRWEPLLEPKSYGVLPLICGTLLIVVGSSLISIPVGIGTAVYLTEYADSRVRSLLKPALEVLAGIPSVVYGYFALMFITPILKVIFPSTEIFNAASAAIVVGIMTLPMMASLCDDAFYAVPRSLRHGGYALGATPSEVIRAIVIPFSSSRILAAFVLAVSRAIGETMAVTLAAGATPNLSLNPLESIQTMTSYIVQVSLGDTPAEGIEYKTSVAVALLLFVITFLLNSVAHRAFSKQREVGV